MQTLPQTLIGDYQMAIECIRKNVPTVRYEGCCENCKSGFRANEGDLYFINNHHKKHGQARPTNCTVCNDGLVGWKLIGTLWATKIDLYGGKRG